MDDRTRTSGPFPRRAATLGAAIALTVVVTSLAAMTIDRAPTVAAGAANFAALRSFWIASALAWLALTALAWALAREAFGASFCARVACVVITVGLGARIVVLFTHAPTLSDDVYRYVFDGHNVAAGVNPYLPVPAARTHLSRRTPERWPDEAAVARRVNNGEMTTVYLPVSQGIFGAAALLTPDRATIEGRTRTVRAVMVAFETVLMVLLAIALCRRGRSAWWLALYAWHPLPLSEIAGSGHQDVIGVALLVAALVLADARPRGALRWVWALALAALVKPVVVPVAAFVLRGRPRRDWLVAAGAGAVLCLAITGPVLLTNGGAPLEHLRDSAQRFALKWAHFGGVYEPVLWVVERATPSWTNDPQEQVARAVCTLALAVVFVTLVLRQRDPWRAACGLLFAMVLLSPTAHPWYLLWSLALLPVVPRPALWIASLTLPWGYAVLGDTVGWSVEPWLLALAYAPVGVALAYELRPGARRD